MHLFLKSYISGKVCSSIYIVGWQKRGLPLAHILLWLCTKINSTQIDTRISVEIPDPGVISHVAYSPYGAQNPHSPCMKEGKCTQNIQRILIITAKLETMAIPRT